MIKKDDIIKGLVVEKIVHNGYGLSRFDKKTFFIPYTIEKEKVIAKVVENKTSITYALPEKIVTPSEYRIEPKCKLFKICGGCDFLHIDYKHQPMIKKKIINESLQKNNIKTTKPVNFIPSPQAFNYRLNARFHVDKNKIGFIKKHSIMAVPVDNCPLLDENINHFIKSIKNPPPVKVITVKTDNNNNLSSNINNKRLQYSIEGLKINYDHRIFFQTNKFLIEEWLKTIGDYIEDLNKKRIIELYCGIGIISLYLAKRFRINKITGIDKDNTSINFAKMNRTEKILNQLVQEINLAIIKANAQLEYVD